MKQLLLEPHELHPTERYGMQGPLNHTGRLRFSYAPPVARLIVQSKVRVTVAEVITKVDAKVKIAGQS